MQRAGDLVQSVTAPPWATSAAPMVAHPDYCACHKAAGEWGNHGMHWREYGEIDIRREVDRAVAALPMDSTEAQRDGIGRSTRQRYGMYAGLHVAIAQCPAYFAVVKRECDQRKADKAREARRGGMTLGDDL